MNETQERTITRLDLVNLEQRIRREVRARGELSATQATALRLVDLYREAHGWDDDSDSREVG
jgi:hypothetical protein